MRVLTNRLDKELAKLLKNRRVSKVDIATAWATESGALDALEEHKKRPESKLVVRTIAGHSGNHTTPDALKRLAKLGKVRLVEGKNGVFHVKLFLFRGELTPLAWVGSANFTGPGFGSNEELLYETKAAGALQKWFDRRWKEIGAQPDQLARYCEAWQPPDVTMPGVDGDAKDKPRVITFVQEGTRPRPYVKDNTRRQPARGVVRIGRMTFPYDSAQECLPKVLQALQQRDRRFLKRCSDDPRFHGRKRHYIARSESGLGTRPSREYAWEICDGWWLTNQTENQLKWRLICAAADVAGLKVEVNGKMWYAEKTGRVPVGF